MKIDASKLILRKATIEDALLTYKWGTDPTVRQNSINKDFFTFESHLKWFEQKLNSPETVYLILMERFPLGQIRFDRYHDGWLISFMIDEVFRNNGLGKWIVENGMSVVGAGIFYAYVVKENIASNKIFESLSFYPIESDVEGTYKYMKKIEL